MEQPSAGSVDGQFHWCVVEVLRATWEELFGGCEAGEISERLGCIFMAVVLVHGLLVSHGPVAGGRCLWVGGW